VILIRDVFRAKFGKGNEAVAALREGARLIKRLGGCRQGEPRLLMDLTGPYFTVVVETTHANLADYEQKLNALFRCPDFPAWYDSIVPLMEDGRREIFTVLE
jgi:hypothetical protein